MNGFLFDLQHLNIKTLTDDVVRQLKFCFGYAKLVTFANATEITLWYKKLSEL